MRMREINDTQAKAMWDDGLKVSEICRELRCSPRSFLRLRQDMPESFPERKPAYDAAMDEDDIKIASKLWAEQRTSADIARHFSVTPGVVSGIMHRNRAMFPERYGDMMKKNKSAKSLPQEPKKTPEERAQKRRAKLTSNKVRQMFNEAFKAAAQLPKPKPENEAYDKSRLPEAKTLFENTGCKWAVADSPYRFCGEARFKMKPWCEHHQQRAWRAM